MSELRKVEINKNMLGYDAWGRNKSIQDYSLFHGVWTFGVPDGLWIEFIDDVEQTNFTNFTSVDGMLKCQGIAGQSNDLKSKRHPRYQPNRGHLYSASMIFPQADRAVNQEFGIFHIDSGIFFRVNANKLYAVRRTKSGASAVDIVEEIALPDDIVLTKGNVFDIQMQWRGVGNIFFFVNLELVHTMNLLGTLNALSMFNPALPIRARVDGDAFFYVGCVDITSEGGERETRQRGSVDTDELSLSTTEVPILAIKIPNTIVYNGIDTPNTRDNALRRLSGFADDNTLMKMYYTRDGSKFTGTTWTDNDSLATVQYAISTNIVLDNLTTNIARRITRRIPANDSKEIENPDSELGDMYLTHGDYIVVTMKAKNATLGGASIEWGAEI